jgi:hypothetical protein
MRKTEKRQAKVIREDLKVWMGWKAFMRCCLIGLLLGRLLRFWAWSDSIYWEGLRKKTREGRESLLNLSLCDLIEAEKKGVLVFATENRSHLLKSRSDNA